MFDRYDDSFIALFANEIMLRNNQERGSDFLRL
jgi:hypothetical protein